MTQINLKGNDGDGGRYVGMYMGGRGYEGVWVIPPGWTEISDKILENILKIFPRILPKMMGSPTIKNDIAV